MELEDKVRILALKKAAIVMNALAEQMQDENTMAIRLTPNNARD